MRPNSNPRRLPIRNIRRGVKFQNKNQSYAPIVRTSPNGASLQRLRCFDLGLGLGLGFVLVVYSAGQKYRWLIFLVVPVEKCRTFVTSRLPRPGVHCSWITACRVPRAGFCALAAPTHREPVGASQYEECRDRPFWARKENLLNEKEEVESVMVSEMSVKFPSVSDSS